MSNRPLDMLWKLPVFVMMSVWLAACGLGMSTADRIERAEAALVDGEAQAASLDLKRALQDEPDNAKARLLLGKAFLQLADPASAESELRRAVALGAASSEANASIASALWQQQKYDELLNEPLLVDGLSDDDRAGIHLMRGRSNLATSFVDGARREFESALALDPSSVAVSLALVSTDVRDGKLEQARRRVDDLLKRWPESADVWHASAALYLASDNRLADKAAAHYQRSSEAALAAGDKQSRLRAMAGMVDAYLRAGELDSAEQSVLSYREISSSDALGQVLDAQVRLARDDIDGALDLLQTVLNREPGMFSANLLMGMAQARLNRLGQAEAYLGAALKMDPRNAMARTMLARVRAGMRQTDAGSVLEPLLEENNPEALRVAAQLRLQAGDTDGGLDFMRRRFEADPADATVRLDYAAALISANRAALAREVISGLDPASSPDQVIRGAVIAVLAKISDGDQAGAVAEAQRLVSEHPQNASLSNFLGRLYAADGKADAARAQFRQAISLAPEDFAGYANLASIEMAVGQQDAARQAFRAAQAAIPEKALALFGLAQLEQRMGDSKAAESFLREAIAEDKSLVGARITLGRLLAERRDLSGAQEQFVAAVDVAPGNTAGHYYLGLVSRATGDMEQATRSLKTAVELDPANAEAVVSLSQVHTAMGRDKMARDVLQDGYDAGIRDPAVVATLSAGIAANDLAAALALVDTVETDNNKPAVVQAIKGDLYAQVGQFETAASAYGAAFDGLADWRLAAKQMAVLHKAGGAQPSATLTRYVTSNPDDTQARQALAQLLHGQGSVEEATGHYETLLRADSSNVSALNNLAWLYAEQSDPRAVDLATRAVQLSPDTAAAVDTLGWAQLMTGDAASGLKTLRKAVTLDPDNPDIRYHMAAALAKTGDNSAAREVLETLLRADQPFAGREQAQALLEGLK